MARPRRFPLEETRSAIIEAAREILCESDAEGLTARRLAARLEITPSAIYRHFPTMSDVLMEVNRQTFQNLDKMFDGLPKDLAPLPRLIETGRRYTQFMQQNQTLWRALFEGKRHPESYPKWYGDAVQALMHRIAELVRDACPSLSQSESLNHASRLYVLAHGAIALHFDGRLGLISAASVNDIIDGAILATVSQINASVTSDLNENSFVVTG